MRGSPFSSSIKLSFSTRLVVEIGITISLAIAISTVTRLIQLPWGGSISFGSLPIAIISFLRGGKIGGLVGGLYGLVDLILNPFIVHPIQILLDYPVPNVLFGAIIGFLRDLYSIDRPWSYIIVVTLAGCAKWSAHWLSGVLYFSAYAPDGQSVWIYSAIYNASHVVPETIFCMILLRMVIPYVNVK
ncbi:MAG: energy-coupled thiamine transporter ThiT [Candidatus Latescibacterota bacterium]|nr:energy-coupled thiamine transporter ThiT [Candidatus Latescibacterota bacterium]